MHVLAHFIPLLQHPMGRRYMQTLQPGEATPGDEYHYTVDYKCNDRAGKL